MTKTIKTTQTLYLADNLNLMKDYITQGKKETVDLIYIDPPFNSKRNYNIVFNTESNATEQAFTDIWSNVSYLDELEEINTINPNLYSFLKNLESTGLQKSMLSYLTAMGIRLYYMRLLLKDTGSIYYHCDPTASHYIKIVMDYVFGHKNFKSEITWQRTLAKSNGKIYPSNTDVILFYTKTDVFNFNPQYKSLSAGGNKAYNKTDSKGRKYQLLPVSAPNSKIMTLDYKGKTYKATSRGFRWTQESFDAKCKEFYKEWGEEFITVSKNDTFRYKKYLKTSNGVLLDNLWTFKDVPNIEGTSTERLGYPTQKPEALLERIIKASSNPSDLVMDFYNGGGTTGAVCKKLDRNYLGCDINYRAIQITKNRLEALNSKLKKDLIIYGIPASATELKKMVKENILGTNKNSRFDLEEVTTRYYLNDVVGNDIKVNDNSIDGTFGFEYEGKKLKGLVQVTSGSNKNHLKAFCSEIGKGTGDLGVYICFKDDVTSGFIQEVKSYGKIGNVDKIQILTFEDLIDNNKQYDLPTNKTN